MACVNFFSRSYLNSQDICEETLRELFWHFKEEFFDTQSAFTHARGVTEDENRSALVVDEGDKQYSVYVSGVKG